ncbi:hypothetical protein RHGRI_014665 [Rhododendron griersonianum]|uniref:Uncharacterized protein n=1 Tax=Rhododendron griersonianum TaxID=479676 RepID=A0AAV6KAA4_9ERIC|nr:hypothetical protein RHGRI_014665 [Rhododendron griersonianum]
MLEVEKIFKAALRKAACVGIVLSNPSALFFVSLGDLNIITYAILNCHERVFNLVHQTCWKYIYGVDNSLNNVLHLAARLGHEQQINLKASVAGAVLQMQQEMQWFKVSLPLLHHVKEINKRKIIIIHKCFFVTGLFIYPAFLQDCLVGCP